MYIETARNEIRYPAKVTALDVITEIAAYVSIAAVIVMLLPCC